MDNIWKSKGLDNTQNVFRCGDEVAGALSTGNVKSNPTFTESGDKFSCRCVGRATCPATGRTWVCLADSRGVPCCTHHGDPGGFKEEAGIGLSQGRGRLEVTAPLPHPQGDSSETLLHRLPDGAPGTEATAVVSCSVMHFLWASFPSPNTGLTLSVLLQGLHPGRPRWRCEGKSGPCRRKAGIQVRGPGARQSWLALGVWSQE